MLLYLCQKEKETKSESEKKFSKPIDKHRKVCYNNNVKGRWATAPKKIQKSLKKPLDKSKRRCYNKGTKKQRVVIKKERGVKQ